MFEINATLPLFLIMFITFMYLLNNLVLKPIGKVMEEREQKIRADIEAGNTARTQASEKVTAFEQGLHEARLQGQAKVNQAIGSVQEKRQNLLKSAQDKGMTQLQETKEKIAAERKVLVDRLVEEEKVLVSGIVKKLVGDSAQVTLDDTKIRRALEEAH